MKYLCLVYCDEKLHSNPGFPEDVECLAYGEALKKSGHLIAAEPCNPSRRQQPCGSETVNCPSPTGLSPRRRSNWPASISSMPGT